MVNNISIKCKKSDVFLGARGMSTFVDIRRSSRALRERFWGESRFSEGLAFRNLNVRQGSSTTILGEMTPRDQPLPAQHPFISCIPQQATTYVIHCILWIWKYSFVFSEFRSNPLYSLNYAVLLYSLWISTYSFVFSEFRGNPLYSLNYAVILYSLWISTYSFVFSEFRGNPLYSLNFEVIICILWISK